MFSLLGVFAFNRKDGANEASIFKDRNELKAMPKCHDNYAEWMSSLSMGTFKVNKFISAHCCTPLFADKEWSEEKSGAIFSSISVTRDGFWNKPHEDDDVSPYACGLWNAIWRATGKPQHKEKPSLGKITGTKFVLLYYHLETDLCACEGNILMLWASDETHYTSESTTTNKLGKKIKPHNSPITLFGSSCQINAELARRIGKVVQSKAGKTEEEYKNFVKRVVKSYHQEVENKLKIIHDKDHV